MELTGASESTARSVFMHVCCQEVEDRNVTEGNEITAKRSDKISESFARHFEYASEWFGKAEAVPAG